MFKCDLKDGRSFLAKTDGKTCQKIAAEMFEVNLKRAREAAALPADG